MIVNVGVSYVNYLDRDLDPNMKPVYFYSFLILYIFLQNRTIACVKKTLFTLGKSWILFFGRIVSVGLDLPRWLPPHFCYFCTV